MPGATRYQQGNEILDMVLLLPSVTFPTLAANASGTNTATVQGVQPYDLISWNMIPPPAHLTLDNAYCLAPNVITFEWGTDSTGIAGATVPLLIAVTRCENANALPGGAAIPSQLL